MKIASWNVNSLKVRLQHVLDWLQAEQPDVLGLQETKSQDENFPLEEIEALGYHVSFSGQKTYNGVALISKYPIEDVVTDLPGLDDPQRRVLIATINGVRIFNLYVPNGSSLESDKYPYKLGWLEALKNYTQEQLAQHDK
jgi:exodeoxyribonuclease-3